MFTPPPINIYTHRKRSLSRTHRYTGAAIHEELRKGRGRRQTGRAKIALIRKKKKTTGSKITAITEHRRGFFVKITINFSLNFPKSY